MSDLALTLNRAYADYYVPVSTTPESFAQLVERESIKLDASVIAVRPKGNLAGLGLLAQRGIRGWIGGLGVIPKWRRRGLGREMMNYLIAQARDHGIERLQLEVITQNTPAHDLYVDLGFETERKLLVLFCADAMPVPNNADITVRPLQAEAGLDILADLGTMPRPWQRERPALAASLEQVEALAAYSVGDDAPIGILLTIDAEDNRFRVMDFAAESAEAGEALLTALVNRYPKANMSYVNVLQNDPMAPVLDRFGFAETLAQWEMFYTL